VGGQGELELHGRGRDVVSLYAIRN
jgi:hypothetical protein